LGTLSFDIKWSVLICLYFPLAQQPWVDQNLLVVEASRSHSPTLQSIGLLWTSDQPVAETLPENKAVTRNIHAPHGIRTRNSSKRVITGI
jgi:hypothetical protein